MITTPADSIERNRLSAFWGRVTLDEIFRKTAAANPDRLALVDAPDRSSWTGGEARQLTYAEAEREIQKLAAFYAAVGLSTDHVIGIQAPNTVDTVIAFLAALRAGLIVSPLPLHWRQRTSSKHSTASGPRASWRLTGWRRGRWAMPPAMWRRSCSACVSSSVSARTFRTD
ncbi:AMP-binding protein [Pannonibacter phragmitetus]|uniref:AMP-binding protein n=1 Tax=Pannonibacter phragmitetus TaxID=121719 RepID=UPI003D2F4D96